VHPSSDAPRTLSATLRARTKDAHVAAERSGVMASLLRGQITPGRYVALLRSLHAIYDALERGLDARREDPCIAPIHDARLWRTAALERDLVFHGGPAWAALPPSHTALGYAHRLDALRRDHPAQLAAHAYVRYLGDLNGGQILARIVRQALQLAEGAGTAFYEFELPEGIRAAAGEWRSRLDSIPMDDAGHERLADEALLGFEMHIRLFDELAATPD
jgi:heme oxygenase